MENSQRVDVHPFEEAQGFQRLLDIPGYDVAALARAVTPQFYLPFEGDATLSIILSKAFLLAEDKAIKDPVILRQLAE